MLQRSTAAALVFLVLTIGAMSAPAAPAQERIAHRLDNGLLVLAVSDSALRQVIVGTSYFAGFRDEPETARGLAHLTEHLAMREVADGSSITVRRTRLGITGGATTTGDLTSFSYTADRGDSILAQIFELERLRMTALAITDAAVEAERRRVAAEVGSNDGDAGELAVLFSTSRLSRGRSHRDLRRLTAQEIRHFHARYYVPANVMIVVQSPFPASEVLKAAERVFAPIASGERHERPYLRYRAAASALAYARPIGVTNTRTIRAFVVPGVQHPERLRLEREVQLLRTRMSEYANGSILIDLTDDSPVSLLRFQEGEGRPTPERLLDSLIALTVAARRSPNPPSRSREAPYWASCEAAGNWRYCLDIAKSREASDRADTSALSYLSAILTARVPRTLWPSPVREVRDTASTARRVASSWTDPDTSGWRWQTNGYGVRWLAVPGGKSDSVFFAAWLRLPTAGVTARQIAALEVLARTWSSLRVPDGAKVEDSLRALGASFSVSSLPYPPLATSSQFRDLGTPVTPIGVLGIQILGSASLTSWPDAWRLVERALTQGVVDSATVDAELARQQRFLAGADSSSFMHTEVVSRSTSAVVRRADPAWRPDPLERQRAIMADLRVAEVANVPGWIQRAATMELAILGASRDEVERVVEPTRFATPDPPAAATCEASAVRSVVQTPGPRGDVEFTLCIPRAPADEDPSPWVLANAILGGREDALLARRLRGETGLAYDFASRLLPVKGGTHFHWHLHIGVQTALADSAIAEVTAMLRQVSASGVPGAMVTDFREWLAGRRMSRTRSGRDWVLAVVTTGMVPEVETAHIRAVTPDALNAALRHWRPERMSITAPR